METINVEKIMEEIREEIKEKGYTNEMLSFRDVQGIDMTIEEYNEIEYALALHNMGVYAYVPWYRDLPCGGVKKVIKKVIRKLCSFLIAPISDQQSDFNMQATKGFAQIAGYIEEVENQFDDCRKTIKLLEQKIEKLEKEIKILKEEKE